MYTDIGWRPVGEIFVINRVRYVVVPAIPNTYKCTECDFYNPKRCAARQLAAMRGGCSPSTRGDGLQVVFKRLKHAKESTQE